MIRIANSEGHQVRTIVTDRALASASEECEVLVLDPPSPDRVGQDLKEFTRLSERAEIVLVLSEHNPDLAEKAITWGAWDYFHKPVDVSRLKTSLLRAIQSAVKKKFAKHPILTRCGILGSSPAICSCLETAAACARNDSNLLIYGETGTGKELFARAVHFNSTRKDMPFIPVDCASLPESLVESILFGHEKGAFTTAEKKYPGIFRLAHSGTLFLDEVGELLLSVQKTFLRALQERCFRPVGGTTEVFSSFRLISATNKNLDLIAEHGLFRRDLLFRLRTVFLELPPLRGRQEDIIELAHHFLNTIRRKHSLKHKEISAEALDIFAEYSWPGNVRELISTLEHAVIMCGNDPVLYPEHLPRALRVHWARRKEDAQKINPTFHSTDQIERDELRLPELKAYRLQSLEEIEKNYLLDLLRFTDRNIPKSCAIAGISRARLYAMIKKYGL